MKNKKLFAILTLVCFMMTLMPVAAFAAAGDATVSGSYISTADKDQRLTKNEAKDAFYFDFNGNVTSNVYIWVEKNGVVSTD